MSELEWSQLAREQDNYTHECDRKQQEQKLILKQMYKNQLLKMINEHNKQKELQKNSDRSLIKWQNQRERAKMMLQQQERDRKQKAKQEMARYNYQAVGDRKNKSYKDHEQMNKFYMSKYKKSMTEAQEKKKQRIMSEQNKKQQLSRAYESQIINEKNRKLLQKLEDRKFTEMREEIERKKQENRMLHFKKLQNYRQNPEVYQYSKTLITQADNDRKQFIDKLISDDKKAAAQLQKRISQERKLKRLNEVGKFNRNYYENKALRERLQSMQQINQYHQQYLTLANELENERERKLRQKQEQKRMLKDELQRQIQQSHLRQSRKNRLNEKESRINRSGHIATLPGITNDFSSEKQQKILYNFLGGKSSKSVQRSY